MIDLKNEKLILLFDAIRLLPIRPNKSTLWRWHARGINGHRLEVLRAGKKLVTSEEALLRFLGRTAGKDAASQPVSPSRAAAIHKATAKLQEDGI
jgi:hypothetical protein